MYGTGATTGGALASTGLMFGSKLLAGFGLIMAGVSLKMLARKSNPIKP